MSIQATTEGNHPYLIQLDKMGSPDLGYLTVAQYGEYIPFEIKRVFWNYAVPEGIERGNHAYYQTQQVLVALSGSIRLSLESVSGEKTTFTLQEPDQALFLPPLYWRHTQFFGQAILAVFSSHVFDPTDVLRDYDAFRALDNI